MASTSHGGLPKSVRPYHLDMLRDGVKVSTPSLMIVEHRKLPGIFEVHELADIRRDPRAVPPPVAYIRRTGDGKGWESLSERDVREKLLLKSRRLS